MPWLTPDDIPEDDSCRPLSIPADSNWLALISGALTELTKPYNWEKRGALTVSETVAKMQSIIDNYYDAPCAMCVTPGGYRVIRISIHGVLEQLDENGGWVEATDEYHIPPPEARTEGSSTNQVCLAAKNATNVLKQLYSELADAFASNLSEAEALTAFIALLIAIVGFEFAPITWGIAALVLAVFEVLYRALAYVSADLWTEDFDNVLICILISCASNDGGVVTFDNDCFNDALNAQLDGGGLSEVQLRLYAQVGYILLFIGGIAGLNLAGRTTEITDDDCSVCGCEPIIVIYPWENVYDPVLGGNDCGINSPNCVWNGVYIGFVSPIGYTTQWDMVIDLGEIRSVTHVEFAGASTGVANAMAIMSDDGTSALASANPPAGYETGADVILGTPHSTRYLWLRGQATNTVSSERNVWLLQAAIYYEC